MLHATTRDVAAAAGVDPSTVSRVLNRPSARHHYAPATVRKVRAAANRLGYRPSRTAQALRTGKTCNLGLVVADIANPFWAELAARIERLARDEHYRLLVCNTDESAPHQEELLADLARHGVDGLIVAPCGADGLPELLRARVPVVTIDRELPDLPLSHVGLDDRGAGHLLGQHLHDLGYRQVGVVAPSAEHDPSIRMRVAGLTESIAVVWETTAQPEAVRDRLQTAPTPGALVGLNNTATLAALEALAALGRPIPDAIGLAGIDDFLVAQFSKPAITVAAQPLAEIATTAVRILMEQITYPTHPTPLRQLLAPVLVRRDSLRQQST